MIRHLINAEEQALIFKAFEQAKVHSDGVGRGLFIARSIIEGMGGQLLLQSEPDKENAPFWHINGCRKFLL